MVSLGFLYFFLPVFTGLYAITPKKFRGKFSLFITALIIAVMDPFGLIPLTACVFSAYLGGIFIFNFRESKNISKGILIAVIIINVAAFLVFRRSSYDGYGLLSLPGVSTLLKKAFVYGSSVYPLHAISYCIDIYRGKYLCEHRFSLVAQYVSFFPVLAAGPLLRYDRMRPHLEEPEMSLDMCANGISLLMLGLFRKLVLADTMFELWRNVKDIPLDSLPAASAWIGMAAFTFFVYFEISAFSFMASGLSSIMGIEIPNNFREPYAAYCYSGFIRRFNRTLYKWSHDYIYKSLLGDEKRRHLRFLALIPATIFAFIWYGFSLRILIFSAALLIMLISEQILEKPLKKLPKSVRRGIFFFSLLVIMPFFAFVRPEEAANYIAAMFGANKIVVDTLSEYMFSTFFMFFIICLFFSTGVFSYFFKKKVPSNIYLKTIIQPVWTIALLILCTAFLVSGNKDLFTYLL